MNDIIQEALTKGVEQHVAGKFEIAAQLYRSVLRIQPNHADANHNMGLLKLDTGLALEALPYLQTALQADTSISQFWISYIGALITLKKFDEAIRILNLAKENGLEGDEFIKFERKLSYSMDQKSTSEIELVTLSKSKPNILDTLNFDKAFKLAKTKNKNGKRTEAQSIYQDILEKFPKNKRALRELTALSRTQSINTLSSPPHEAVNQLNNLYNQGQAEKVIDKAQEILKQYPQAFKIWNILGAANKSLGCTDQASKAFQKAIQLNPLYADGFNNFGVTLADDGKLDEAAEAYKKALAINPRYADALNNLGNVLKDQGKIDEALKSYKKALAAKPNFTEVYNNIGNVLQDQGMLKDAVNAYNQALAVRPNYAVAWNNLGKALKALGKFQEARKAYNKAISIMPDYAEALLNLGRLYWLTQDFQKAFDLMEARWKTKTQFIGTPLKSPKPAWKGEENNNVFVWKEQGIGDHIMFSSILYELEKKSNQLVVECDERLKPLYQRSFPRYIKFVSHRDCVNENDYDHQIAIGSLPKYFRNEVHNFRRTSFGWLKADPQKISKFRKKLKRSDSEKIIGISWVTNSSSALSRFRNLNIDMFTNQLQKIPAKFVSLQYGDTSQELRRINAKSKIGVVQIEGLDLFNDLEGLAALISVCDIVISIDNVSVHLAGALGVDTRVLLPFSADERWSTNQNESYWYDSLTLYRQTKLGDWSKPLAHLVNDLVQMPI